MGRTDLPAVLLAWRLEHGLKMQAAARELGVATSTWGHWETGRRFPNHSSLILISLYTGLPLLRLLCADHDRCPFRKREPPR